MVWLILVGMAINMIPIDPGKRATVGVEEKDEISLGLLSFQGGMRGISMEEYTSIVTVEGNGGWS